MKPPSRKPKRNVAVGASEAPLGARLRFFEDSGGVWLERAQKAPLPRTNALHSFVRPNRDSLGRRHRHGQRAPRSRHCARAGGQVGQPPVLRGHAPRQRPRAIARGAQSEHGPPELAAASDRRGGAGAAGEKGRSGGLERKPRDGGQAPPSRLRRPLLIARRGTTKRATRRDHRRVCTNGSSHSARLCSHMSH
jgi:hypothetical protein